MNKLQDLADEARLANDTPGLIDAGTPAGALVSSVNGWTFHEFPVVTSTNLVAANLPAWNAIRADTQTAGRGRFQRQWVSDAGGLWLSAVVPIGQDSPARLALPLAAGLAVCDTLRSLGVHHLRMRWPNDLLVNDRKLAGLLIDQFNPAVAVVGIGINVGNQPEVRDPLLNRQTARLVDLLPAAPTLPDLAARVLHGLQSVVTELLAGRFELLLPRVNALWGRPRRVELDLDGTMRRGTFAGVLADGRLVLRDECGGSAAYHPWQVRHLAELSD